MKLSVKDGVKFDKDSVALGRMLATLLLLDYEGEVIITSGSDGEHMPTSKHYTGQALDLRKWGLMIPVKTFIVQLQKALGPKFSVLEETSHLHIQVRKGGSYP